MTVDMRSLDNFIYDMDGSKHYYYYDEFSDQVVGPHTLNELRELEFQSVIHPDTKIAVENSDDWILLSSLGSLPGNNSPESQTSPPPMPLHQEAPGQGVITSSFSSEGLRQSGQSDLTSPIIFKANILVWILILLGCLLFVCGGVWILTATDESIGLMEKILGILVIVFFGGSGVVIIPQFLNGRPSAVLDQAGLTSKRYQVTIEWRDITQVGLIEVKGQPSLCLSVRDYEKYRKNVHWTGALMTNIGRSALVGGAVIALSKIYDQYDPDVDDALEGARGYDFFWAKYEFPGMKLEQVAALIESEAKKAQHPL